MKGDSGGYIVAEQTTVNRPLSKGRNIAIPAPHFTRTEIKQYTDNDDDSDHIIQKEISEGFQLSLLKC